MFKLGYVAANPWSTDTESVSAKRPTGRRWLTLARAAATRRRRGAASQSRRRSTACLAWCARRAARAHALLGRSPTRHAARRPCVCADRRPGSRRAPRRRPAAKPRPTPREKSRAVGALHCSQRARAPRTQQRLRCAGRRQARWRCRSWRRRKAPERRRRREARRRRQEAGRLRRRRPPGAPRATIARAADRSAAQSCRAVRSGWRLRVSRARAADARGRTLWRAQRVCLLQRPLSRVGRQQERVARGRRGCVARARRRAARGALAGGATAAGGDAPAQRNSELWPTPTAHDSSARRVACRRRVARSVARGADGRGARSDGGVPPDAAARRRRHAAAARRLARDRLGVNARAGRCAASCRQALVAAAVTGGVLRSARSAPPSPTRPFWLLRCVSHSRQT